VLKRLDPTAANAIALRHPREHPWLWLEAVASMRVAWSALTKPHLRSRVQKGAIGRRNRTLTGRQDASYSPGCGQPLKFFRVADAHPSNLGDDRGRPLVPNKGAVQKAADDVMRTNCSDDLSREVYCILGIPVDAIDMQSVVRRIESAAANKTTFLVTTPNLNFLVNSLSDPEFRESLLLSDLCPADGMPIVWIARLLGIPIKHRIAGSDFFAALKNRRTPAKPLSVFLFGGAEGVAEAASRALNATPSGLNCVGTCYPGFGSVEEMSRCDVIHNANSSNADFLVASLGAKKGQSWLMRNHHRLLIPVRAHLGAAINFEAGTLRRAPLFMQKFGLEWLWRIKEEPYLWRRYWTDANVLLRLLLTRVLPLIIGKRWLRLRYGHYGQNLLVAQNLGHESVTITLSGAATAPHIDKVILAFRNAIATKKSIMIDFSNTTAIDARFLGLLLVFIKATKGRGARMIVTGLSPKLEAMFRLNGVGFLLSADPTLADAGVTNFPAASTSEQPLRAHPSILAAHSQVPTTDVLATALAE
jgi:N-acetylglucosaminyldiphosphoundecaprenol N-acetyl-beta-D-mannosaminyltransferase